MSNKTQLQTNNDALDGYIARINAAKDVAANLPEAGGGGGGSVETGTLTATDNGMYEPGSNEYILSSPNLNAMSRNGIIVSLNNSVAFFVLRDGDSWMTYRGNPVSTGITIEGSSYISNNAITVYGNIDPGDMTSYTYIAF